MTNACLVFLWDFFHSSTKHMQWIGLIVAKTVSRIINHKARSSRNANCKIHYIFCEYILFHCWCWKVLFVSLNNVCSCDKISIWVLHRSCLLCKTSRRFTSTSLCQTQPKCFLCSHGKWAKQRKAFYSMLVWGDDTKIESNHKVELWALLHESWSGKTMY